MLKRVMPAAHHRCPDASAASLMMTKGVCWV
jgi:hypothetical protein